MQALVTEGILPVAMHRDGIFMFGRTWERFHCMLPSVSFDEFWALKLCRYEIRDAALRKFFVDFEHDHAGHAKTLADRALRQEIRRIRNCSNIPYTPPKGFGSPNRSLRNTIVDPWNLYITCLDEEKEPLHLLILRSL